MNIENPILSTYSVIELAKLEGSLAGIISGFALTISILLIERHRSTETDESDRLVQLSIASFLVALVASLATAFNFMVIGAEMVNEPRLAVQFLPISFALAQSYVYLFTGIALALFEYRIAEYMRGFLGVVCAAALLMVGGNMQFSTLWSVAVWENVKLSDLLERAPVFSWGLLFVAIVPSILIGVRIAWPLTLVPSPWRERFDKYRSVLYIRTATAAIVMITLASLLSSFMSESVPELMRNNMRLSAVLIVTFYAVISGMSVIFLPRRV